MGLLADDAFNAINRAMDSACSLAERRAIAAAFVEQSMGFYARLMGHAAAARAAELSRRHHEQTVRIAPGARRRT